MLRQTVERKPLRNPISVTDNTDGESDKSTAAHLEALKHALDADEMSERRTFPDGHAHFRPPALTTPDARDGYRQKSRSPNESPAWIEADTAFPQGGRKHRFRQDGRTMRAVEWENVEDILKFSNEKRESPQRSSVYIKQQRKSGRNRQNGLLNKHPNRNQSSAMASPPVNGCASRHNTHAV